MSENKRIKRKCLACGWEYEFCPTCGKETFLSAGFNSERCRDIFGVVSAYNAGTKTLSDVTAVVERYSTEPREYDHFLEPIKKVLIQANALNNKES